MESPKQISKQQIYEFLAQIEYESTFREINGVRKSDIIGCRAGHWAAEVFGDDDGEAIAENISGMFDDDWRTLRRYFTKREALYQVITTAIYEVIGPVEFVD